MEYVRKDLVHAYLNCGRNKALSADVIHGLIEQIPVADVREVVHGEWIDETFEPFSPVYHPYKCNICYEHAECPSDFCPNCGADMRGGK